MTPSAHDTARRERSRADSAEPWRAEVAAGTRFTFGRNWESFLSGLDESRVAAAERSLEVLGPLAGVRFLDIGCGSGLFSLAARRRGAEVHSFDYDDDSVRCTETLQSRFFPEDSRWTVEQGSVLDTEYLGRLGNFDVVYSWGVLHHTGAMWVAIENALRLVRPGGRLFIAIYNDQGAASQLWRGVKRVYNGSGRITRAMITAAAGGYFGARAVVAAAVRPRTRLAPKARGMSWWHDVVDWIGGYPFEVARPEEVIAFARERGFELHWLKTVGGKLGCNEFLFRRAERNLE